MATKKTLHPMDEDLVPKTQQHKAVGKAAERLANDIMLPKKHKRHVKLTPSTKSTPSPLWELLFTATELCDPRDSLMISIIDDISYTLTRSYDRQFKRSDLKSLLTELSDYCLSRGQFAKHRYYQ